MSTLATIRDATVAILEADMTLQTLTGKSAFVFEPDTMDDQAPPLVILAEEKLATGAGEGTIALVSVAVNDGGTPASVIAQQIIERVVVLLTTAAYEDEGVDLVVLDDAAVQPIAPDAGVFGGAALQPDPSLRLYQALLSYFIPGT